MNIGKIFKYYLTHIKKHKVNVFFVFLLYGLAVVFASTISPLLYKEIIDVVSNTSDPVSAGPKLINLILILGAVIFIFNLFYRIGDFLLTKSQSLILKEISDDAFDRLQHHSYNFFSNTFTGTLVARVKRYVDAFETIYDQLLFTIWMGSLELTLTFAVLTYFSPILGFMFLAWLVIYIGITILFIKKKIKKDLLVAEANSKTTGVLADTITNILNIKMFSAHSKESSNFAEVTKAEEQYRRNAWYFMNIQFTFQGFFIGFFEFIGMYVTIILWSKGAISAGVIILMQIYIFTAFQIVWSMGRNITRVMRSFADAKEMVDIFEEPCSVEDIPNPEKCNISEGHIKIDNITFSYGENENVFNNLSLDIKAGEKVGLVGPSGAGKTTVTKLLLRFANVNKGKILIDGQDISQITQDDLRSQISYVPQEPLLFHRSLTDNIAYSQDGATEEDIIKAAKSAHAHDFITQFTEGYDTLVGERGIKLSGGERQRVAIARAMLKDAPILILDEATSSLDSISEAHIQAAFDNLMEGRTTLVVAHRLSTIQKMDRIIVFEKGRIAEEGTHEALLANKGLYYELWKQQSHGFMA